MPIELPFRRISWPDQARAGSFAYIAAVLLMLAISCVALTRPSGDVYVSAAVTLPP